MQFTDFLAKVGLTEDALTGAGLVLEDLHKSLGSLPATHEAVLNDTLQDPEVTDLLKGNPSKVAELLHHLAHGPAGAGGDDEDEDDPGDSPDEGGEGGGEDTPDEGGEGGEDDEGGEGGEGGEGEEPEGASDEDVDDLLKRYGVESDEDDGDDDGKLKKSVAAALEEAMEDVVPLDATTGALLKGFGAIMDEHLGLLHKQMSKMHKSLAALSESPLVKSVGGNGVVPPAPKPSPGAIHNRLLEAPEGGAATAAGDANIPELLLKSIAGGYLNPVESETIRVRAAAGNLTDADKAKLSELAGRFEE